MGKCTESYMCCFRRSYIFLYGYYIFLYARFLSS